MGEPGDEGKLLLNGTSAAEAADYLPAPIEIELPSDAGGGGRDTLPALLRSFLGGVLSPDGGASAPLPGLIHRLKASTAKNFPRLREASRNSARDLVLWTRRGSALRALLVISVGSITLLALTGLLVFMFFLLVATANAVIVSILVSLAAVGGFLALFFAFLTAIYIGTLSVAVFIISTTTISTIIAVTIATGWIGFFWVIWLAVKKSLELTKKSINVTSSALSAYSSARQAQHESSKPAD